MRCRWRVWDAIPGRASAARFVRSRGGSDRPPDQMLRLLPMMFPTGSYNNTWTCLSPLILPILLSSVFSRWRCMCRRGQARIQHASGSTNPYKQRHLCDLGRMHAGRTATRRRECRSAHEEARPSLRSELRPWSGRRRDRGAAARAAQSRNAGSVRTSVTLSPWLKISTQRLTGPTMPVHPGPCLTPFR